MSEIFERLCPYYMMYGMSYEDYWFGDPWQMKAYKNAYDLRNRQKNTMLWLEGAYFNNAVSVALANAFRKKGSPPVKYLEKPLDVFPKTEMEEQAEMERKQKELILKLTAWKKASDAAKR